MELNIIISLITLVALEIVLGIDNVIFISILAGKLPKEQQTKARRYGLILAMFLRLALLGLISLVLQLKENLFFIYKEGISGKDLILILGGVFLLYKSSVEIYHKMEGEDGDVSKKIKTSSFVQVIVQILIMDMVFSIDSIITAIGMVEQVWVMCVAVVISVGIMLYASGPISRFVDKHPAFKMLALSFLLLIGFSLVCEGLGIEIPKAYIYFAMAFSFFVDLLQMRMNKKKSAPIEVHEHYLRSENKIDE